MKEYPPPPPIGEGQPSEPPEGTIPEPEPTPTPIPEPIPEPEPTPPPVTECPQGQHWDWDTYQCEFDAPPTPMPEQPPSGEFSLGDYVLVIAGADSGRKGYIDGYANGRYHIEGINNVFLPNEIELTEQDVVSPEYPEYGDTVPTPPPIIVEPLPPYEEY